MNNQDRASELIIEIAKTFIETLQSIREPWRRGFLRFQMPNELECGCNGSYETENEVHLIGALDYSALYETSLALGQQLRQAAANNKKAFRVFLLTVDHEFNFNIEFEHADINRWRITKLDGASGLPAGVEKLPKGAAPTGKPAQKITGEISVAGKPWWKFW